MRTVVIVSLLVGFCVTSSFAADSTDKTQHFEGKKAEVLKNIEQRIAHNQEEKACVQAAANHDALKACRDKFRTEMKQDRQSRNQ